jgi:hypothetical protein
MPARQAVVFCEAQQSFRNNKYLIVYNSYYSPNVIKYAYEILVGRDNIDDKCISGKIMLKLILNME